MKLLYFALNDVSPETLDKLMVVFWITLAVAVVMFVLTIYVVWLKGWRNAKRDKKEVEGAREPKAVPPEPILERVEDVVNSKTNVDQIDDKEVFALRNELRREKIERIEETAKRYEKHSSIAKAFCIVFVVLISIAAANCFNSLRAVSFVSSPTDAQQSYSSTVGSTYRFVYIIGDSTEPNIVLTSDARDELKSESGQQIAIWVGVAVVSLIGIAATCSISSQSLQKAVAARAKVHALQKEIRESTSK